MILFHRGKLSQSRGKSLVRSFCYNSISNVDFKSKKHIVIASTECGDVKYLLAHGVYIENIIACDFGTKASLEACDKARSLGIELVFNLSIEDAVEAAMDVVGPGKIGSVNVGLCGSVRTGIPVLKKVIKVLDKSKSKVFFTFIRRNDGFSGNSRRLFVRKELGIKIPESSFLDYQSWTVENHGAAMTAVIVK